jgi:hypothetical protein
MFLRSTNRKKDGKIPRNSLLEDSQGWRVSRPEKEEPRGNLAAGSLKSRSA